MPLVSIIIPAYNEEKTIAEITKRVENISLPDMEKEIILVNDGSSDRTGDLMRSFEGKHKVINHSKNMGKGAAVRTGFKAAKGDYIIVQDADLELNPEDIPPLFKPILAGRADVVFGSRFMGRYSPKSATLVFHMVMNRFFTIVCNLLSGYRTTDMWTCYKLFTRKALDAVMPHFKSNGIEFEPELTMMLAKLGFRIEDVSIAYNPRWYEDGKKTNWKQAVKTFVKMIGFAFRRV